MLESLKKEANLTRTENGALTLRSTQSHCLDLFAAIGALRRADEDEIVERFLRAYAEDPDLAMKTLFFARDVRGGLGERRVFRVILKRMAAEYPDSVRRNIPYVAEYGRYDDLLTLMGTPCEEQALDCIRKQLEADLEAMKRGESVSLLAKWLPSVNASKGETVRMGKRIARALGMQDAQYRKVLSALRGHIRLLENSLREKDYTFDYAAQPSKAMFKYRRAFLRNDEERYRAFMEQVASGEAKLHTGTLMPYEVIRPLLKGGWGGRLNELSADERRAMDVTWNALEDFTGGENALAVVDGSGSMYCMSDPMPAEVALSLGVYFAQRNTGAFRGHFITFSESPQLVEIQGEDIAQQIRFCAGYNEVANTDLQKVFELILSAALKKGAKQEELPSRLYVISDMEFDYCVCGGDVTNFEYAKQLFEAHGYRLPEVVFWNVASRNRQQPVKYNEQGVALVSGASPRIFSMMKAGVLSPYAFMLDVLNGERYAPIAA